MHIHYTTIMGKRKRVFGIQEDLDFTLRGNSKPSDARKPVKGFAVKSRLWIGHGGETFLAFGRVMLLEKIRESGSISQAARSMNMSYRHAWNLVESMNSLSPKPLIETATGGKDGGGTWITPFGESVIELYWKLHGELIDFLNREQKKIEKIL